MLALEFLQVHEYFPKFLLNLPAYFSEASSEMASELPLIVYLRLQLRSLGYHPGRLGVAGSCKETGQRDPGRAVQ